jgi:hypothetical protein
MLGTPAEEPEQAITMDAAINTPKMRDAIFMIPG